MSESAMLNASQGAQAYLTHCTKILGRAPQNTYAAFNAADANLSLRRSPSAAVNR